MSRISGDKRNSIEAYRDEPLTTKGNISNMQAPHTSDDEVACKESAKKRRNESDHDAMSEDEMRETEIQKHVFEISLPGVEITHCNFRKAQVEVWYVAEETECEKVEEELRHKLRSRVSPHKLTFARKGGLPTFKHTSPGQSISIRRRDGSIGTYVTITDAASGESNLHALVCGHGKKPGDIIYLDRNPDQRIGEVRVAREGETALQIASGARDHQIINSYDVGLILMDEQQRDQHETSVIMNEERIQLANAWASLRPRELADGQQVMLFNNANKQGTVHYTSYNSRTQKKFGMIGIAQILGEERRAVHGMNESGTLVAALPAYQENGENCVKPIGMLVGFEEFETPPESISLAVPIGTNLQELAEDEYCANKDIQFA